MKFKIAYYIPVFIIVFSCQKPSQTEIAEVIGSMIQESEMDTSLAKVYTQNDFKPIWVESNGLKEVGRSYYDHLEEVGYDGLEESDYLSEEQIQLLEKIKESKDPSAHAALDIAISKSFLALASDLNIGRIDPSAIHNHWKLARKAPTIDYEEVLFSIAKGGASTLQENFTLLRPENPRYAELQNLLKSQLGKQAEIVLVDSLAAKVEKGDRHHSIPFIRQKLAFLGDLQKMPETEGEVYDEELFKAVKKFQERHGLTVDGVIGADFIAAINYSHSDLITKIKVNLERLRWLPDFTGTDKNKVIVNIPDFHLYYVQEEDTIFTSRVVVGKDYRQTPVFKADMTYLVFSPNWTLPETILWEDAIPSILQDESYLVRNNMKVLDSQENEVEYQRIRWEKLEKDKFPYIIRQKPGGQNPLGRVKFMFPNEHSIYIHDSPAQSLFTLDERTFSSGCIRMEDPEKFAALLLEGAGDWDAEKISAAMNLDEEKKVPLAHAQDVWILYLTVWGSEGRIEVREDIYGMDRKLAEALSLPVSESFL